jgi:hypothetical protein
VINKEKEMNRFTLRSALVLAAVLLLAGATTSFAQFTTPATIPFTTALSSTNPNPVRIAGGAEWVTDIVATQVALAGAVNGVLTSGVATSTLTYQVVYSAPISNKVLGFVPTDANCVALGSPYAAGLTVAPATTIGIQVVINNITCTGIANSDPTKRTGTTISWTVSGSVLNIVISTPTLQTVTFGGTTVITVKGVRLNVASLGAVPAVATLTNTLATYPTGLVSLATTSFTVATSIVQGLGSATQIGATGDGNLWFIKPAVGTTNTSFGPCNSAAGDLCNTVIQIPGRSFSACAIGNIPQSGAAGSSVLLTGNNNYDLSGQSNFGGNGSSAAVIGIKIQEGSPGILGTKATEITKSSGVAGTTEVDAGTRFRFDISGLPTNVVVGGAEQIDAGTENTNTSYVSASGLTVDLVAANYCVAGTTCTAYNRAIVDIKAQTGGAVAFEYEVSNNTGGTTGNASSVIIPFWLFKTSSPVDTSTVTIAVRLGPILGGNIVRFSDTVQTAQNVTQNVTACSTTIFYPYVANNSGFDTGIWILNGSDNQSGTCDVKYTQTLADGTVKSTTKTTGIILAKAGVSFMVSDATMGNAGMLNGFVRVTCKFEGGHGIAYITYSATGAPIGSAPPGTIYLALQGGNETAGRSNR